MPLVPVGLLVWLSASRTSKVAAALRASYITELPNHPCHRNFQTHHKYWKTSNFYQFRLLQESEEIARRDPTKKSESVLYYYDWLGIVWV
eukprot:2780758-Amphidinium_carterae.1